MSNQDLQREGFNEQKGKLYYRDKIGNWYQKGDGYSGYESIFLNSVVDEDFKREVMNEIQGSAEEKVSLQYEGVWYTIWQNMNDGMQSNINRKVNRQKTDAENTYDSTQMTKDEAKSVSPASDQQNKFSGSQNRFSKGTDGGKKAFYYKNKDFVTLDRWKELNKNNYSIVILPPAQMDPNNYLIKNDQGKQEMWVWIAEKVEMN